MTYCSRTNRNSFYANITLQHSLSRPLPGRLTRWDETRRGVELYTHTFIDGQTGCWAFPMKRRAVPNAPRPRVRRRWCGRASPERGGPPRRGRRSLPSWLGWKGCGRPGAVLCGAAAPRPKILRSPPPREEEGRRVSHTRALRCGAAAAVVVTRSPPAGSACTG